MILRRYRPEDLGAIFRMDEACFEAAFRFDKRSMKRYAEARGSIALVVEGDEGLLGFVIVQMEGVPGRRRGYVVTLDVATERRRTGVAGRLMAEVERLAEIASARSIGLHVFAGNTGAIRFYERLGYVRVGVEMGFYGRAGGEGLDALVYRKEL